MLSRKKARESVYKLIFEYLFLKKPNEKSLTIFTSAYISEEDYKYIQTVYYGVIEHFDEIVAIITQFTTRFSITRIFKLDLAALLLAIFEMKYLPNIPMSVSISEAVDLVKLYSTEKSNQYVNGILSSVYKMLNNESDNKNDG
ncbi:MAG: transcription antitermination factor NusB [Christensenellaceae bacterium]|jgi:N utilization substance protein B|nr:transcription antitermination factor NusB [Christensenellaceae bacterium]